MLYSERGVISIKKIIFENVVPLIEVPDIVWPEVAPLCVFIVFFSANWYAYAYESMHMFAV